MADKRISAMHEGDSFWDGIVPDLLVLVNAMAFSGLERITTRAMLESF